MACPFLTCDNEITVMKRFELGHEIQYNIWVVAVILLPVSSIEIKKTTLLSFFSFPSLSRMSLVCACAIKRLITTYNNYLILFVLCDNKANMMIYKSENDDFYHRYDFFSLLKRKTTTVGSFEVCKVRGKENMEFKLTSCSLDS